MTAVAAREGRPLDVGVDCRIAASARLEQSILWDRITIGENARLRRCVVADDVCDSGRRGYSDCALVERAWPA